MQNLDQVPEYLRAPLLHELEKLQMQDSMRMYNDLVETCFQRCVGTFHTKKLEDGEEQCMEKCATKFMNFSKRIGQRWQEQQAEQQDHAVAAMQAAAATEQQQKLAGKR
jgi:import inner membrane translocase subunit TIM9